MLPALLSQQVQEFIRAHEHDDERKLVLKQQEWFGVPSPVLADQIAGRRKARTKLPTWYSTPGIVYPPGLNLEQSSSEATAAYKSELLAKEGFATHTLADLTGGFGVDTLHFSKVFQQTHWIDPNETLLPLVQHNHALLGARAIHYHTTTAAEFLNADTFPLSVAFADPSRRSGSQKVFRLSDCVPDMVALMPQIFQRAAGLLVKTSPLLDVQQGCKELRGVAKVFVISVHNECKELLFLCRAMAADPEIVAVNIRPEGTEEFSFTYAAERAAVVEIGEPAAYLYEPNASLLKAGAFKTIAVAYGLTKVNASTHLYTDNACHPGFPGRVFRVEQWVKPDPKELRMHIPQGKANVITRNYPLTPEQLKKKVGLQDGGDHYLIGFTGPTKKYLAVAQRIK